MFLKSTDSFKKHLMLFFLVASASASANAETRVRVVAVPDGGQPIAARTDLKGTIHLLFNSTSGPRYARSNDDGKSFDRVLSVVDQSSRKPGLEFTAWDMAVSPDGHVHIAMSTNAWKLKLPQEEWAYYYSRLDPDAENFTPVLNLNRKPSEGFALAADGRGNVTACWLSDKLYANVSHDHGKTFGPTLEIDSTFDPCNCCTTSATYAADGRLAILYREETNNDRDMFLVLWDQVRGKKSRSRVSTVPWKIDACPMSYYSITADRDGFIAAWPTKGDVYFARLDNTGRLRSQNEIKTPGTSGMRTGMLALASSEGEALVVWKKDGLVNWQQYNRSGQSSAAPQTEKSAGTGAAAAFARDGSFVIFR